MMKLIKWKTIPLTGDNNGVIKMKRATLAEFNLLINQLEYALERANGKTTLTKTDIDLLNKVYLEVTKNIE